MMNYLLFGSALVFCYATAEDYHYPMYYDSVSGKIINTPLPIGRLNIVPTEGTPFVEFDHMDLLEITLETKQSSKGGSELMSTLMKICGAVVLGLFFVYLKTDVPAMVRDFNLIKEDLHAQLLAYESTGHFLEDEMNPTSSKTLKSYFYLHWLNGFRKKTSAFLRSILISSFNKNMSSSQTISQPIEPSPRGSSTTDDVVKAKRYKLILLGDSNVGKTNFISRLNADGFNDSMVPTVGVEFITKEVQLGGESIKVQIWDTAGQERYNAMMTTYYRKAKAALLLYDIANRDSFDHLESWYATLMEHAPDDIIVILVGNKCDLKNRQVSTDQGQQWATSHGILFQEASARENKNVYESFFAAINCVYQVDTCVDKDEGVTLSETSEDARCC